MLEWNFNKIMQSSIREILFNEVKTEGKAEYWSKIVRWNTNKYAKLMQALQVNEDDIALITNNNKNPLKLIFSSNFKDCCTYFEIQEEDMKTLIGQEDAKYNPEYPIANWHDKEFEKDDQII